MTLIAPAIRLIRRHLACF